MPDSALEKSLEFVRLEPRCRVCRSGSAREKVNSLLAAGASYAAIARQVDDPSAVPSDRITIDSIRNHTARHFPLQDAARATYREILERRAEENGTDFANGVASIVNVFSYLEIMATKGLADMTDDSTDVSYADGAKAALKLHELTRRDAGAQQVAEVMALQNRIISAIQKFIPDDRIPALMAHLDGAQAEAIDAEVVENPATIRDFDADAVSDDDDDDL